MIIDEPGPEEGGEDVFTPFPTYCERWHVGAISDPESARLYENEDGFWVCPICGVSYGRKT